MSMEISRHEIFEQASQKEAKDSYYREMLGELAKTDQGDSEAESQLLSDIKSKVENSEIAVEKFDSETVLKSLVNKMTESHHSIGEIPLHKKVETTVADLLSMMEKEAVDIKSGDKKVAENVLKELLATYLTIRSRLLDDGSVDSKILIKGWDEQIAQTISDLESLKSQDKNPHPTTESAVEAA